MWETLQHIDEQVFKSIHVGLANECFDIIMPFFRNPFFWAPVYLFLFVYMWSKYKLKGLLWCGFFLLSFAFADFISASLIKPLVGRVRPCNDDNLSFIVRDIVGCGAGKSFPSSHASNHFAISFFIIFTIAESSKWIIALCIFWASLVSIAQVYVGVHYPFDVMAGALLGLMVGLFVAKYFNLRVGLKG